MGSGSRNRRRARSDGLPSSERVYVKLKEMILSAELPPQTRLVETQLAEQFQVSRTPVREALKRLAAEQLVLNDSVRGLVVHAPKPHEVEDVYLVRDPLEALAARLAARRITEDEMTRLKLVLESMQEAITEGRTDLIVNANGAFHSVIYRAAGSPTLSRLVNDLRDFVRRFSSEAFASPQRASTVLEEHEAILQALQRRDEEGAAAASSAHIRAASSYLVQLHLRREVRPELERR